MDADGDGFGSTTTASLCSASALLPGYASNNTDCDDNKRSCTYSNYLLCRRRWRWLWIHYLSFTLCGYSSFWLCFEQYRLWRQQRGYPYPDNLLCGCRWWWLWIHYLSFTLCGNSSFWLCFEQYRLWRQQCCCKYSDNLLCGCRWRRLWFLYHGITLCGYSSFGLCLNNTDCDDNNAAINPAAQEICGNGVDDNCNQQIDEIMNATLHYQQQ